MTEEREAGQQGAAPAPAEEQETLVRDPEEVQVSPVQFGQLDGGGEGGESGEKGNLELLLDVPVSVSVVVGRTRLPLGEVVDLGPGAVIELDKKSEEPIDLCVNGKLIAHGEVVVVDDTYGIRITQIVDPSARLESLKQE